MGSGLYNSPIGKIIIKEECGIVTHLDFADCEIDKSIFNGENGFIRRCFIELDGYFAGKRKTFTVDTAFDGTPFRVRVWRELAKIPYGAVISYKTLAERVGSPGAARAVGGANHHNNISIIIPCHRVIGADGSPVGYGGGIERKKWLLEHERRNCLVE